MTVKRLKNQSFLRQMDALPPLLRFGLTVLTVVIAAIATRTIPVIGERAALLLFFSRLFRLLSGLDSIQAFSRRSYP